MSKERNLYLKAASLISLILLSSFYVSLLAVDVRALKACCEKSISGDYCLYTDEENCDQSTRQINAIASCEQTSYCQVGCCYGLEGQNCVKSTGKAACEAKGGTFSTDASCNSIAECRQVCCQLGNECSLTTQDSCQELASSLGITAEIKDVTSESQCLSYCKLEESGCCTTASSCSYTKSSECSTLSGSFSPGKFCSSLQECKSCKARSFKGCLTDQDDVYWFDSCGNPEGIAEDCSYLDGTICGDVSGNIQCKSVDCETTIDNPNIDWDGVPRKNGESWCSYEGATGLGRDLVGSRQYRHVCINGEEIIEPCADYRQEYCVQGTIELNNNKFSEAFCVPNKGEECITDCSTGDSKDDKKCCQNNPSCIWTGDDESGSCLPLVPPGSTFWEGRNEDICNIASQEITVYWQKETFLSDWDCVGNCQVVKDKDFAKKFDSYCAAFGDCGAYYNYIGEFTQDGYSCSRSDGSCIGNIHGDRFNLVSISKDFFGNIKKPIGLEFENLVINDPSIKLPSAITIAGRTLFFGAAGLVSLLGGAFVEKYRSIILTVGTLAFTVGAAALLKTGTSLISTPVGWALVAAGIFFLALGLTGDQDDTTFSFSCEPWQAPPGGQDCEKCDADPSKPCTEYKCKSLGQTCEYIPDNEGSSRPKCFNANPNDINSPVLSPLTFANLNIKEEINGYLILDDVPANKRINLGIKTDELAQCRFADEKDVKFDDMPLYFGSSFYSITHNITINPLSAKDYSYYIRCRDKTGNTNQRDYIISFSSSKGPDFTPPSIEYLQPANNAFVAFGTTDILADMYLNEQARCRYSAIDIAYESMPSNFNCLVSQDPNSALYRCQASLPFSQPLTTYNIRCIDVANNTNTQSYRYTLKGTQDLVITSKKPVDKVIFSNQTLDISTAGGAESGKSVCRFSPDNLPFSAMIDFFITNSTKHIQQLVLEQGSYNYNVKCMDIAGNEAEASLAFSVEIDKLPPKITRLYKDSSYLYLVLNEPGICEYSSSKFAFGQGTRMPEDNTITHSAILKSSYYIECKDLSGNSFSQVRVYP